MRLSDPSPSEKSSWHRRGDFFNRAGLVLLALYVLAGVVYSVALPTVVRFSDEEEYLKLSHHLLHGPGYSLDGVHLTAARPPGYAFFLVPIQAIGGGFIAIRIVQFLLLAGTILLVCRLWDEQKVFAGTLVVSGLVICYPVLFYTSATLYPQTLAAFLFLLALHLAVAARGGLGFKAAAGFVFGALILVVPTFVLTLMVVIAAAMYFKMIRWQDGALIALSAVLVVGTWTLRNAVVFHRFVPVASNGGGSFLMGNNEHASPFEAAENSGIGPYYQQTADLGLDEFQCDQYYKDVAAQWISTHPGRALVLYLEKVLNFFNVVNVYLAANHEEIPPWKQVVMAISYLLLMGLLARRLASWRRFPLLQREKLFLAIYVLSAFTSAIFFTRIRHRLPYDFLLIAIVAPYLSQRLEHWLMGPGSFRNEYPKANSKPR